MSGIRSRRCGWWIRKIEKYGCLLLKDGKLDVVGEYSEGQSFSSTTLGELSIDLDKVFQSEVVR